MSDQLPEGYLDPYDAASVAALISQVQAASGTDGVLDLLGRLPGCVATPGRGGGLFRAAVPATLRLGTEYVVTLAEPPVLEHVVSGVVLQREPLHPGRVGTALPPVIADLARELGARVDTSVVLTAVSETLPAG